MPVVFPLLWEGNEEDQEADIFLGREGASTLPVPPLETKKSALF